jgi:hypothetical protein
MYVWYVCSMGNSYVTVYLSILEPEVPCTRPSAHSGRVAEEGQRGWSGEEKKEVESGRGNRVRSTLLISFCITLLTTIYYDRNNCATQ